MARSTLTKVSALGSYPTLALTANSVDLPMAATVVADKTQFVASGKDLVIAHNTGGSAYTVTITSVADGRTKRTGDITSYSIGAGEYAVFGPFEREGWMQSDGYVYLESNDTSVKFGVVTLPQ